jgi:putative heme iron utilization protein
MSSDDATDPTSPSGLNTALPADNRLALRRVTRACRKTALATLMEGDGPYVSLVTVAFDHDMAPILLLSGLADHTRNLSADRRVSLLFDGTEGHANPQTGPRLTLTGVADLSRGDERDRLAARFLARHPAAALYAGFGDFGFWRVRAERAHFVGGFGRAVWFDAPFGLDPAAAAAMAAAESGILDHMNASHDAAIQLFARALGGAGDGWRMTGIDPDGCDLAQGDEAFLRLAFDAPLDGAAAARAALVGLVERLGGSHHPG